MAKDKINSNLINCIRENHPKDGPLIKDVIALSIVGRNAVKTMAKKNSCHCFNIAIFHGLQSTRHHFKDAQNSSSNIIKILMVIETVLLFHYHLKLIKQIY